MDRKGRGGIVRRDKGEGERGGVEGKSMDGKGLGEG